jgi:3-oxoacyl-[acyl-carrier protein] reductase
MSTTHNGAVTHKLQGKLAIVTGASKGIGAAIARQLAAEGADVVVNYSSSRAGADRVVREIESAGGRAAAIQADLSKEADTRRLIAESRRAFGGGERPIDILVNNAGIYEFAPLESITPEHFRRQFDLNVLGLLLVSQEAVKHFNPAGGSIINISSVAAASGLPQAAVYGGTKAAVDAATRSLAAELGPRRIRVNSVNPGMVETEGTHAQGIADGEMRAHVESVTPLGRIGLPHDIAPAVAFLASDESSWISGETLRIAGGYR